MTKTALEASFYPWVAKWMSVHFRCFKSAVNVGLRHSRIDVLGIRDVGGILSGEVETICIEVKRGSEPFATASGQALGYSIYANRVYLADLRETNFSHNELDIASHLGIGLIQLSAAKRCKEVLSSPLHNPLPRMSLEIITKLALAKCQICGTFFESGKDHHSWYSKAAKNLKTAVAMNKGLAFWLHDLSTRKKRVGIGRGDEGFTVEKRFVCPECIQNLFAGANRNGTPR